MRLSAAVSLPPRLRSACDQSMFGISSPLPTMLSRQQDDIIYSWKASPALNSAPWTAQHLYHQPKRQTYKLDYKPNGKARAFVHQVRDHTHVLPPTGTPLLIIYTMVTRILSLVSSGACLPEVRIKLRESLSEQSTSVT